MARKSGQIIIYAQRGVAWSNRSCYTAAEMRLMQGRCSANWTHMSNGNGPSDTSLSGLERVKQPHLPLFELLACRWVKDEISLLIKIGWSPAACTTSHVAEVTIECTAWPCHHARCARQTFEKDQKLLDRPRSEILAWLSGGKGQSAIYWERTPAPWRKPRLVSLAWSG